MSMRELDEAEKVRSGRRLLSDAADAIERNGWTQGETISSTGGVCALGAIGLAAAELPDRDARCWAIVVTAKRILRNALHGPIAEWNDAPRRTKDEVVAKLREVAQSG
jgi:hypothetical protein